MHQDNNKRKNQKTVQIKGKMPATIHFCRNSEASALNIKRAQLDKTTLLTCAMKQLRGDGKQEDGDGKEPAP